MTLSIIQPWHFVSWFTFVCCVLLTFPIETHWFGPRTTHKKTHKLNPISGRRFVITTTHPSLFTPHPSPLLPSPTLWMTTTTLVGIMSSFTLATCLALSTLVVDASATAVLGTRSLDISEITVLSQLPEDVQSQFRLDNTLKTDCDPRLQRVGENGEQTFVFPSSGMFSDPRTISFERKALTELKDILSPTFELTINDVVVENPTMPHLFRCSDDFNVIILLRDDGMTLERAIQTPATSNGETMLSVVPVMGITENFYATLTADCFQEIPIDAGGEDLTESLSEDEEEEDDNEDVGKGARFLRRRSNPSSTIRNLGWTRSSRNDQDSMGLIRNPSRRLNDECNNTCAQENEIQVDIVIDSTLCAESGNNATRAMENAAMVVAGAESLYHQLCTRFKVEKVIAYCAPDEDPISAVLSTSDTVCNNTGVATLQQFKKFLDGTLPETNITVNRTADMIHLFYSFDVLNADSTIGCAFEGRLCQQKSGMAVDNMKSLMSVELRALLFAHETGHLLNAPHVNEAAGIMFPSVTNGQNAFVPSSEAVIKAFIASPSGSCVSQIPTESCAPTSAPVTQSPTEAPTGSPTQAPNAATASPTASPSTASPVAPTNSPTIAPTTSPTVAPTGSPTKAPTASPTASPTSMPSKAPVPPTKSPTVAPTGSPTKAPTASPTASPTSMPSKAPVPTSPPTSAPTKTPTVQPTASPTRAPVPTTSSPTQANGNGCLRYRRLHYSGRRGGWRRRRRRWHEQHCGGQNPTPTCTMQNFSSFDPAQYLQGDNALGDGVGVQVQSISNCQEFGARVFDTSNPTGGDYDLGYPSAGCGNLTVGQSRHDHKSWFQRHCESLGNALIIQKTGLCGVNDEPNDFVRGGNIIFKFNPPVKMVSVGVLDVKWNYLTRLFVSCDWTALTSPIDLSYSTFD